MDKGQPGPGVTRAVLVDAGGVLFTNVTEESGFFAELAGRHAVAESALRDYVDRHDAGYETGARHVHEVLGDALAAAGAAGPAELDAGWTDALYLRCAAHYPDSFDALRRLRTARPELTLALANNEAEHWDQLKDGEYGHLALFDVVASSWQVGAVKPTEEYFERTLAACGCAAGEVLFLDDNPDVVAAARRLGVTSRLLRSPGDLAPALAGLFADPFPTAPPGHTLSVNKGRLQ